VIDLSPPHLPRHQKAGPANHGRTVADDVNIDFPQQSGNALLAENSNALVFGRLHDKLRFRWQTQLWRFAIVIGFACALSILAIAPGLASVKAMHQVNGSWLHVPLFLRIVISARFRSDATMSLL
jgi:hypothetical protein